MATYTVKSGDTIGQLAKQYGMKIGDVLSMNPGVTGGLQAGQTINLGGTYQPPAPVSASNQNYNPTYNQSYQPTPANINTQSLTSQLLSGQVDPNNVRDYISSQVRGAYGSDINSFNSSGQQQINNILGSLQGQSLTYGGQNYTFGTGGSAIKTSTTNRMSTTTPTGTSVQTSAITPNSIQSGINSYTVKSGDTLSAIASRMGVPISQLTGYRSGNPNLIYPGEVITIKGGSTTPTGSTGSITSSSLLPPTSSYNLSSTSYNTGADAVIGGVDATTKSLQDYINMLSPSSSANKTNYDFLSSKIQELLPELGGRGQAQLTAEEQRGVNTLKQSLTDINNQITQKMAEYKAVATNDAILSAELEDRPITMNSIIGAQAQANKIALAKKNAFASDIGLLQAQAQVLQGNLTLAQESANRAVDLKYSDTTDYINILSKQLDLVKDDLTKEEGIRADAIKLYLQDQKDKLAVSVANQKDMNSTLLNLMQSYPDAGISLSDSIESANQKITNNSAIYRKSVSNKTTSSSPSYSSTNNQELITEPETPETSTGGIWDWVKGAYNYVTGNKTTTPMTTGSSGTTSSGLNYTIK